MGKRHQVTLKSSLRLPFDLPAHAVALHAQALTHRITDRNKNQVGFRGILLHSSDYCSPAASPGTMERIFPCDLQPWPDRSFLRAAWWHTHNLYLCFLTNIHTHTNAFLQPSYFLPPPVIFSSSLHPRSRQLTHSASRICTFPFAPLNLCFLSQTPKSQEMQKVSFFPVSNPSLSAQKQELSCQIGSESSVNWELGSTAAWWRNDLSQCLVFIQWNGVL